MAWLCKDKNGTELIFNMKPYRDNYNPIWMYSYYVDRGSCAVELPSGSIRKLIGRELTWEDEPVEIKEE